MMEITIYYETLYGEKRQKELANVVSYEMDCTMLGENKIEVEYETKVCDYEFYRVLKIEER